MSFLDLHCQQSAIAFGVASLATELVAQQAASCGIFIIPNCGPTVNKRKLFPGNCAFRAVNAAFVTQIQLFVLKNLAAEGISAEVINIHTIKPLDTEIIAASAAKTGAVVTAEEHNIIGGLGGAVCEALAEACPVPVVRVGVEDRFGMSGKVPELLAEYGLTKENIIAKAKKAISLKK